MPNRERRASVLFSLRLLSSSPSGEKGDSYTRQRTQFYSNFLLLIHSQPGKVQEAQGVSDNDRVNSATVGQALGGTDDPPRLCVAGFIPSPCLILELRKS